MTKKQIPFNVLPTKKVKKALFATLATVTVLSQMLTVYPTTSAAAEGSEIGTTEAATQVGDFAALKDALEKDNGITNIELTADITMTGPINVHLNKTEVTINGNGHTFTESKLNLLSYTATVYVAPNSKMKTMNIKNMKIRGTHYYSTFQVHDAVTGVVQNFENIDYVGPQMVANTYGTANFTGTNTVNISQFDNVGTLYQMVRANKVNIAGNFTADHNTDGLNTFQLYGTNPQLNILDNANVNIKVKHDKLIGSAANTTDFTVGKNATLNIDTVSELFVEGMSNIIFDTNSTTTINRTGVGAGALMEVAKNFTINSNASLVAKQPAAATAHIIRTTVANATININDPRKLDLDASGTGANRVFSAYGKTTINFNNLAEIGVFNATNKTETPTLAWQDATFQVVQASAQAGIVQTGAISSTNDIQTKFVLADAKRITTTGTAEIAQKAVNELFTNNDTATDTIKDTTTQASIDAAQALVNKVTDPATKAALQKDLDRAQELLNERNAANSEKDRQAAALKAVNELFNNDQPSTDAIKDSTNQEAIDAAQKLVDAVTDPVVKAALQKDLDRAQELLDARNAAIAAEKARQEAALKAVNELFNSDQPSTDAIKDITNQEAIDAAQKLVDAVTDPSVKAALQKDLDRAQELLDARNAVDAAEKARQEAALKAVNELFNSDNPSTDAIKGSTTQDSIDAAQKLVDAVTDPTVKAELQKDLDRAQELLDARNAAAAEKARQEAALKAVNELFNSDKPSTDVIKDTTTQATIDAAQKLIDAVTDPAVKAALQKDLNRAQELLNERLATVGTITPADFLIGGDKYVTGTFTGSVAKVSLLVNDKEYTGGTVKADGTFTFYANDKNIKKTDEVFAVAYDKYGKELSRTKVKFVVVTAGKITPATYSLATDKNITGTYTEDVTKITVTVGDKVYKGGTVANGTFTFYAFDKIKNTTDPVTIHAYDAAGKLLDTKTLKVVTGVPVVTKGSITPLEMAVPGDKNITGTYTDDVHYVVVTVNGIDYKGGTFADGEFKFYALDKISSANDVVTMAAYDKAGKLLDTKTIKLVGPAPENVIKGTITPNQLVLGTDKNITGTYTGEVKSVQVTVNDTTYKGGTFTDGEFKFYSHDKVKSVTDEVIIVALDKAGNVLDTKTIEVVK
ncbi:immunoglobulin-like domain-containing protein [Listeria booriae]|uniref:Bacterial Ig domain-containing protein n=2 Tax=Listeria booriae TaxID=1552123 RepID=A0A099W9V9_9LIST|nr:immunoglobulin-like domain-containing protein [Listeria booriae]KGL42534.1 hypothetical protein EP57_03480 [Listeria booriae]STY40761.1 Uncharacterised protein [Listeria booriae]